MSPHRRDHCSSSAAGVPALGQIIYRGDETQRPMCSHNFLLWGHVARSMMLPDKLSAYKGPGFCWVLSQPGDSLPTDEYHHWYNTEHGPARLKLDNFLTGFRYKSRSPDPPVWLACYDLKRVSGLTEPQYTTLREKRSERERDVLNRMKYLDRRIYALFSSRGVDKSPAPVLLAVKMYVKTERVDEVDRWYEEVGRALPCGFGEEPTINIGTY
jgi:hypothetical protein